MQQQCSNSFYLVKKKLRDNSVTYFAILKKYHFQNPKKCRFPTLSKSAREWHKHARDAPRVRRVDGALSVSARKCHVLSLLLTRFAEKSLANFLTFGGAKVDLVL